MNQNYNETPNGYLESINKGIQTARKLSGHMTRTYSGERFEKYFGDFKAKYNIRDMYTGGFYPFPDDENRWAWWSRHIYVNRYVLPPKPVYNRLLDLVKALRTWITSSRRRASTRRDCSIPREITVSGSAACRVIKGHTTTKEKS